MPRKVLQSINGERSKMQTMLISQHSQRKPYNMLRSLHKNNISTVSAIEYCNHNHTINTDGHTHDPNHGCLLGQEKLTNRAICKSTIDSHPTVHSSTALHRIHAVVSRYDTKAMYRTTGVSRYRFQYHHLHQHLKVTKTIHDRW